MMLFEPDGYWGKVSHDDPRARWLADRHYSRQTVGARDFTASGRKLVLLTHDASAVWATVENMDQAGNRRFRCTIFRNEGLVLSSVLIAEATARTYAFWKRRHHGLPSVPLTTEVNPDKVSHKRDPGRCFRKAGWTDVGILRGLWVLRAPLLALLLVACGGIADSPIVDVVLEPGGWCCETEEFVSCEGRHHPGKGTCYCAGIVSDSGRTCLVAAEP